jgi:hypothetical protein
VTFEEAKRSVSGERRVDLFESLARDCLPEHYAAELVRLLAAEPAALEDEDRESLKRVTTAKVEIRDQLSGAWSSRPRGGMSESSYGSGTTLIVAAPADPDRKPPDPEAWWRDAPFEEREQWLLAWNAERTGLVEVLKIWDEPCPSCRPGGGDARADPRCRDCGGAGFRRKVRWR